MNSSQKLERLKQKIKQAFEGVPLPAKDQLVVPTDELNRNAAEKTRELFFGQEWHQLDLDFLKEHWAAFCYFRAESFQYYLPALLIHSLAPWSDDNTLLSSTICELTPKCFNIFQGKGVDRFFEYQTSTLTHEQYCVIAEFLHCIIDGPFSFFYRYSAALAIRWGFSRYQNDAVRASQALYDRLYHHTYPDCEEDADQLLVEQITEAFANTPVPIGERLTSSQQTDEPYEISIEFQGTRWQTLHPDFLSYHSSALSFFTAEAFRYYLPAFLIASIHGAEGNANPIFHLAWRLEEESDEYREYAINQMSLFSPLERTAIIAYLESHLIYDDEVLSITHALDTYWKPSLTVLP